MSDIPMKKQALLIGINKYKILPGLKYARQDAEAVADSLKQNYCFSDNEILLLTDDRPGLLEPTDKYIIQDHLEKLANQKLDLFIFGFWGHGLFRNDQRYFCPLNVKKDRAEVQGLPFDELQELVAKIHAKNTFMILDCCQTVHDRGDESETLTSADQTVMENAARDIVLRRKDLLPDFQSNVAILNSCKEGQSAYEWDARQHGLFTALLLDAMNKRSSSVMQIASYISSNIEKSALELGKDQTPFYKLEGDIILPVETDPVQPKPDPKPTVQTIEPANPLAKILEKERRQKQEKLVQLQKEAAEAFSKEEYAVAISKCEDIMILDPNSQDAKDLTSICKSRLEIQKEEQKRKEREEQKQREKEDAEKAGDRTVIEVNGVEFAFRYCPAGTFTMGSPKYEEGRYDEEMQHPVTLTKGFWMMGTQVTQKQWKAVMGDNPSDFEGDDLPVEQVSWNDCQEFCKRCTLLGLTVHLPTEAQWEYACRAGTVGEFAGDLDEIAWYSSNSGSNTHSVGTKQSNAWGLYDMHGNVWEWCQDWKADYPDDSITDPTGPLNGFFRVIRGGSWYDSAESCRSASRKSDGADLRSSVLGFRCVKDQ